MYEDVFAWILDAFDQLKAMEDLANDLETIKIQVNSKFFFFNKFILLSIPFHGSGIRTLDRTYNNVLHFNLSIWKPSK